MSSPDGDPAAAPSSVRWWICGLLLLATTLNYMDRVALNQTSKEVMDAFGLNADDWGKVESAFSFAFALGTLAAGWLVDRVGVYWVYPVLVLGWSCAGFLTGYASGFESLIAFRFLLGLFEAGNWPCGIRTTRQVLPPGERSFGNSLFQSGTALGAIITPFVVLICSRYFGVDDPDRWRWPFRVIGVVGLAWVAGWLLIVPRSVVKLPPRNWEASEPFVAVFSDRRFWVVVAVVLAVNTSWHTFRVWMPLYLRNQRGFTADDLQYFSIAYYLSADVGAWAVGLAVLAMNRTGRPLHQCRLIGFLPCVFLVLGALALPFVSDAYVIAVVLLLFALGALGLFTTYFSLSQELSAVHQGKVTGSLGFINAIYLAGLYRVEGRIAQELGRYDLLLAVSGIPALIAFGIVLAFWNRPEKVRLDAARRDDLPS